MLESVRTRLRSWLASGDTPRPRRSLRTYFSGADQSRLVTFMASLEASHREVFADLVALRAHSRDLAKNNAYMARYIAMVQTHVVGPEGIQFESEILGNKARPKEDLNDEIERGWTEWGRAVSTDGRLSWVEFQHLVASTVAVDGECLIRMVSGYPNPYRFALEIIDPDRLDWQFSEATDRAGNRTVMGVRLDSWGRPLGYHITTAHPADYEANPTRTFIPAGQIIHVYSEARARSIRGIPWGSPVMPQLNMLGRLWNSELAAANLEADRLGILKTQAGVDPAEVSDPSVTAAEIQSEAATFLGLDPGMDVVFPQLQHPNTAFPEFTRALLKGIAAGLGVSYHSLAADVSDANYSSARVALLEERDTWRRLQGWFIRSVCDPIFRAWLDMAVASGQLKLPAVETARLCAPRWWPRSWEWVDPQKDINASILAIQNGLSTYQEELGSLGRDWRDVLSQRAVEQAYLQELGLSIGAPPKPAPEPRPMDEGADDAEPEK